MSTLDAFLLICLGIFLGVFLSIFVFSILSIGKKRENQWKRQQAFNQQHKTQSESGEPDE